MITGSLRLRGLTLKFPAPVVTAALVEANMPAPTPVPPIPPMPIPVPVPPSPAPPPSPMQVNADQIAQSVFFTWAVPGGDLGVHRLGDRLATTLSATYKGEKVDGYSISAGTLPADVTLNQLSGILIGTLRETGLYVFTIRAQANTVSSDSTYSLSIQ